jgi:hypothetical protein
MNDAKYIGMDVHQATISAAVRDSSGNLVMEATLKTKAETIRVCSWLARQCAGELRRRNVCLLVARSSETSR